MHVPIKPLHEMEREYRTCTRCVMDTTDPNIVFDSDGVCNHCHYFDNAVMPSLVSR